MMNSKVRFALAIVCAFVAGELQTERAAAVDRFWQGDVNNVYGGASSNGNWNTITGGAFSPRASNSERAVIGTDDPAGALNSDSAPFGSPTISANTLAPGGVALGVRVVDYEDLNFNGLTNDFFYDNFDPQDPTVVVAPFFDTSTLVGRLTINSGGNLAPITTAAANFGADGRVLVGVQGRGYLTMTGGTLTLNNTALEVGGPNITTDAGTPQELGPSMVDLSGNATVNLMGGTNAIANLDRRLRVTGPSVNFSATGRIRFTADSSYTAVITDASNHSSLHTTNNALLNGSLNIEFSGAAATRDPIASLGETWTLVDSSLSSNAIDGNFNNLGPGGVVNVSGLDAAHAAPLGANYRVKKVAVGGTSELQLSYEQTLVMTVNRDTGQLSIRNPLGGDIAIDSYSVTSARGSLLASYNGLGAATPGAGVWVKPTAPGGNTVNALSEVKEPDFTVPIGNQDAYDLSSVPSVSLGTGFSRTGVAANVASFGFDGEDLIFEFSGPGTGDVPLRGQIEYVGTKFENDLVLRVNPNNGQAFIKNDSLETLQIDGYSVLSSTNSLNGAGFTGLGAGWQTSSPTTAGAISQTRLDGATTLAPGAELAIGDISSTNFTTAEAQAGLSIRYLLAEGLTEVNPAGDYNDNGVVDAADYTVWRDNLGEAMALTNQSPLAITRALVDQEDYDLWKANFGAVAGLVPDTTFRTGSVVFSTTAGAGSGALAATAVPEPNALWLMFVGLGAVGLVRRSKKLEAAESNHPAGDVDSIHETGESAISGAITMSNRNRIFSSALAGTLAVLLTALSASAATQGIPLINGDFSLPGPFGEKVVAFGETGVPFATTDPIVELSSGQLAGGIPGWTFTGGSGIASTGEINAGVGNANPDDFGDGLPGDSGTEGVGDGTDNNEIILSTFDGKVFQTSSFNVTNISANEKYQIGFDVRNIFTRGMSTTDPMTMETINPMAQLTARVYYVNASSVKQTLKSFVVSDFGGVQRHLIQFQGNSPSDMALLAPAIGRPIGIEFDTTSFEYLPDNVTDSWVGIDNVVMQISGIKRGDLNGDGNVNLADYAILRDNLNEAHTYEFEGELTNDYVVNLDDFRLFKTFYEAANPGAGALTLSVVPEPSSAMLLILAVGGAVATLRKRLVAPRGVQALLATAAGAVFFAACSVPASAELLMYEPFNVGGGQYNAFTPTPPGPDPEAPAAPVSAANPLVRILGQNPTVTPTLFNSPWIDTAGNTPTQFVRTESLVYRGAPSSGGAVTTVFDNVNNPTLSNGEGRVGRNFGPLPGGTGNGFNSTTSGTYYLSFMASYGTVIDELKETNDGSVLGFRTTEIWPEGGAVGNDAGRFEIGYQGFAGAQVDRIPSTARLHFTGPGTNGYQYLTDTTFNEDNGNTHLIVMKMVMSPDNNGDTISLFLDPVDTVEPIIPSAVAANINFTMSAISTISVFGNATGERPVFDELRIGTEYIDVLPELPLPGDTNGDDLVDMLDYQAIISHMNLTGQPLANGDVTGDGRVTIADYRYWKDRRTDLTAGSGAIANSGGVPEPASFALVFAGLAGAVAFRFRSRKPQGT